MPRVDFLTKDKKIKLELEMQEIIAGVADAIDNRLLTKVNKGLYFAPAACCNKF
jgi:hypothetical protein